MSEKNTKAIMDRRSRLLGRLFTREPGVPAIFKPRPGMEHEACMTWKEHGVCPECNMRAISVGRCGQCGWESAEVMIRKRKALEEHEARKARIAEFLKGGD